MRTALALVGAFTLCIEFLYSSKKIAFMQRFNTVHQSFEQVTSRKLQIYNRDVSHHELNQRAYSTLPWLLYDSPHGAGPRARCRVFYESLFLNRYSIQ
jgi:hypothetical protein